MKNLSPFENPSLITATKEKLVEERRVDDDVQIVSLPPQKKC